ncbi:hypothetical protein STENM327S_04965 [Streptomyces tendae]
MDARDLGDKATRGPRVLSDEHVAAVTKTIQAWRRGTGFRLGRQSAGHLAVAAPLEAVRAAGYSLSPADYADRWMSTASPAEAATEAAATERVLAEARRRTKALDGTVDALSYGPLSSATVLSYDGLPHDWRRVPLGELVDIMAGPSYTRLPAEVRSAAGDLRVVMPKHLREGRIDDRDMEKVSVDVARALARFRLRSGDILCVRSGAQMPPALVEKAQDGWLFSTNLLRLRALRRRMGSHLSFPATCSPTCLCRRRCTGSRSMPAAPLFLPSAPPHWHFCRYRCRPLPISGESVPCWMPWTRRSPRTANSSRPRLGTAAHSPRIY